jgi:hypothetical protein
MVLVRPLPLVWALLWRPAARLLSGRLLPLVWVPQQVLALQQA